MATALFQCANQAIARNLERCLPVAPVQVINFQCFADLSCITFMGDCANMYWWCMGIAEQSPKTVAFIGIDERAMSGDDPYKLCIIGNLPRRGYRSKTHSDYFVFLVEAFMRTVTQTEPLDDEWLQRICSQCTIGNDNGSSANFAMLAVRNCECYGRKLNYMDMLDNYLGNMYSVGDSNTMVRVMAHLCYLKNVVDDRMSGVAGVIRRFLG